MIEKDRNKEEQNEFAENIKGEIIYILDAESGKKGYFCIGCKTQMQAVKSKIRDRKSYFRHDATDVKKSQRECTFSNQNYRHSQAMSILNRIKRIKVPLMPLICAPAKLYLVESKIGRLFSWSKCKAGLRPLSAA